MGFLPNFLLNLKNSEGNKSNSVVLDIIVKKHMDNLYCDNQTKAVDFYFLDSLNFDASILILQDTAFLSVMGQLLIDYDSYFQESQRIWKKIKNLENDRKQPRYIPKLISIANERDQEQSFMIDQKEARNRKLEEVKYGKIEQYMTISYKKKIEEDRKFSSIKKIAENTSRRNQFIFFNKNVILNHMVLKMQLSK